MKIEQYKKEREGLSNYIQKVIGDNTLYVLKVLHGNHDKQVQLYLTKRLNDGYSTSKEALVFVELDSQLPCGINIYSDQSVNIIKHSIKKDCIKDAIKDL